MCKVPHRMEGTSQMSDHFRSPARRAFCWSGIGLWEAKGPAPVAPCGKSEVCWALTSIPCSAPLPCQGRGGGGGHVRCVHAHVLRAPTFHRLPSLSLVFISDDPWAISVMHHHDRRDMALIDRLKRKDMFGVLGTWVLEHKRTTGCGLGQSPYLCLSFYTARKCIIFWVLEQDNKFW